jgi:hypothetical protein
MASATYLSNPVLTINAVDLTDMCTAATLTNLVEALEDTAFGTTSRSYTAGLANNEVTLTMYASFAASETYATPATARRHKNRHYIATNVRYRISNQPNLYFDWLLPRVIANHQRIARRVVNL